MDDRESILGVITSISMPRYAAILYEKKLFYKKLHDTFWEISCVVFLRRVSRIIYGLLKGVPCSAMCMYGGNMSKSITRLVIQAESTRGGRGRGKRESECSFFLLPSR